MAASSSSDAYDDFETDEWSPEKGSFLNHAIAGSLAGVAEHSVMFPVDTIKTMMQVQRAELAADAGLVSLLQQTVRTQGSQRMWRGVQTMFTGCVPAHGAYFTIYETLRPALGRALARRTTSNSAAGRRRRRGAAAAIARAPPWRWGRWRTT